jgi:uncharacterized membrane protein
MTSLLRSRDVAVIAVLGVLLGAFFARAVALTLDGRGLEMYFTACGHSGLYLWVVVFGAVLMLALAVAVLLRLRYLFDARRGDRFAASNPAVEDVLGKWPDSRDS